MIFCEEEACNTYQKLNRIKQNEEKTRISCFLESSDLDMIAEVKMHPNLPLERSVIHLIKRKTYFIQKYLLTR